MGGLHIEGLYVSCNYEAAVVSITTGDKFNREGILVDLNNPTYKDVIALIRAYNTLSDEELIKTVKEWL